MIGKTIQPAFQLAFHAALEALARQPARAERAELLSTSSFHPAERSTLVVADNVEFHERLRTPFSSNHVIWRTAGNEISASLHRGLTRSRLTHISAHLPSPRRIWSSHAIFRSSSAFFSNAYSLRGSRRLAVY